MSTNGVLLNGDSPKESGLTVENGHSALVSRALRGEVPSLHGHAHANGTGQHQQAVRSMSTDHISNRRMSIDDHSFVGARRRPVVEPPLQPPDIINSTALQFDKHLRPHIRIMHYSYDSEQTQPPREVLARDVSGIRYLKEWHHHAQASHNKEVAWVHVQGLNDRHVFQELAEVFSLHEMAVDAIVNTPQRVKTQAFHHHQLYITRMLSPRLQPVEPADGEESDDDIEQCETSSYEHEQVSIIVGPNYVLSFQECYTDAFDAMRDRVRNNTGHTRRMGADYLAYCMIDTIIDSYYPVLEALGDELSDLETEVILRPRPIVLSRVTEVKRELMFIRRAVWPQREALNILVRGECRYISDTVRTYFRDCYDHCIQLADILESYRELGNGLLNTYLSALSAKTNEIMKFLTIVGALFIPLTFLAGVYGMNFKNMPELQYDWAYPTCLLFMLTVSLSMLYYFKRQGWICVQSDYNETLAVRPRSFSSNYSSDFSPGIARHPHLSSAPSYQSKSPLLSPFGKSKVRSPRSPSPFKSPPSSRRIKSPLYSRRLASVALNSSSASSSSSSSSSSRDPATKPLLSYPTASSSSSSHSTSQPRSSHELYGSLDNNGLAEMDSGRSINGNLQV